jgi:hypothetical protein
VPARTPTRIGDIYQLKITLDEVEPTVWRRVEVPATITLARLHDVIQGAMGWSDSHLHEFRTGGRDYGQPDPDWDLGRKVYDDRRARLDRVVSTRGSTFLYVYDFGDDWQHIVKVEAIRPAQAGVTYPRVTGGARACPPEDVGSVPGYERFRQAIADPSDEEHDDMLEWIGGEFDPEAFEVDSANEAVRHPLRLREWVGE